MAVGYLFHPVELASVEWYLFVFTFELVDVDITAQICAGADELVLDSVSVHIVHNLPNLFLGWLACSAPSYDSLQVADLDILDFHRAQCFAVLVSRFIAIYCCGRYFRSVLSHFEPVYLGKGQLTAYNVRLFVDIG